MRFYFRPFENVEFCLNRACTALTILALRELLHLFMTNKGRVDILQKASRELLGLQYQLTPIVRVQSRLSWHC